MRDAGCGMGGRRSIFGGVLVGTEFFGGAAVSPGPSSACEAGSTALVSVSITGAGLAFGASRSRCGSFLFGGGGFAGQTGLRGAVALSEDHDLRQLNTMRMWLVRLRIALALPRARDLMRFIVGPSPTVASLTTSVSTLSSLLFSALAMALLSVLPTKRADFLVLNAIRSSAAEAEQALNLARQFPHLEGRHPRAAIN